MLLKPYAHSTRRACDLRHGISLLVKRPHDVRTALGARHRFRERLGTIGRPALGAPRARDFPIRVAPRAAVRHGHASAEREGAREVLAAKPVARLASHHRLQLEFGQLGALRHARKLDRCESVCELGRGRGDRAFRATFAPRKLRNGAAGRRVSPGGAFLVLPKLDVTGSNPVARSAVTAVDTGAFSRHF